MTHDDLTPGEVAAASIIAADTNTTTEAIVQQAETSNKRIVDVANARGMNAEALEIFLGLVYLDYTDDPRKGSPRTASRPVSRSALLSASDVLRLVRKRAAAHFGADRDATSVPVPVVRRPGARR